MTQVFKTVIEPSFVLCYLCLRLLFVLGKQHPRPSSIHYFPILLPALPPVYTLLWVSPQRPACDPLCSPPRLPNSIPLSAWGWCSLPQGTYTAKPGLTDSHNLLHLFPRPPSSSSGQRGQSLQVFGNFGLVTWWLFSHISFLVIARSPSPCTFISCPPQQQPCFTFSTNFCKQVNFWKKLNTTNATHTIQSKRN